MTPAGGNVVPMLAALFAIAALGGLAALRFARRP